MVDGEAPAEHVAVGLPVPPEELAGGAVSDHDGADPLQGRLRVTLQKRKGEHSKKTCTCMRPDFPIASVAGRHDELLGIPNGDGLQDFRVLRFHSFRDRLGQGIPGMDLPFGSELAPPLVDLVAVFMKAVVADFVRDPEQDEEATGKPDGKPGHVDEGVSLLSAHVAKSYLEIIL